MRYLLAALAGFDKTGDNLGQPRPMRGIDRAHTKLLDQQHAIAHRVVWQHRHRVAAPEQFAGQGRAPATTVKGMSDMENVQSEESLVTQ